MAGNNQVAGTDTLDVSVGSVMSERIILDWQAPLALMSYDFSVGSDTSGKIRLEHLGRRRAGHPDRRRAPAAELTRPAGVAAGRSDAIPPPHVRAAPRPDRSWTGRGAVLMMPAARGGMQRTSLESDPSILRGDL